MGYVTPSACSGSALWSPPSWTCLEYLHREAFGRHQNKMPEPPQLTLFKVKKQWFYCELLLDVWASHSVSQGEPRHLVKETYFGNFYHVSESSWPQDNRLTSGLRSSLSGWAPSSQSNIASALLVTVTPIHLSISRSILHWLMNITPGYLNFFIWGNDSLPAQSEHSSVIWQSTAA